LSDIPDFDGVLNEIGHQDERDIDLAAASLALAKLDIPERPLERYWRHIEKLTKEVSERYQELLDNGAAADAKTQLAALKHIIADKHGYEGDKEHYDNLQNANLAHVIDRRKGMPITLSLLYLCVAERQGWRVFALNFPAHVVCAIEEAGERLLFDPFSQCKLLNAFDLRQYLKTLVSAKAELSADYYKPALKRNLLIRLQNNIKIRQIEAEDYEAAVQTVEIMRKINPNEYRLLFDAGVLYARIDKPMAAMRALENYIGISVSEEEKSEAYAMLSQIKSLMN